jgi:putative tricarboxylic transport membrane protein
MIALESMTNYQIVLAAFAGVFWGMTGGALPGISTSVAMALVMPFTFEMTPAAAMVLLGGVYVGSEYGGSIPAILIKTPVGGSSAATVIDGYEMNRQGRGGEALGLSLVGGTIGGLVGLLCLAFLTKPLSAVALLFQAPGYFALGVLGISVIASLSSGAVVKGLISGLLGIMISTVGIDTLSGISRFTFGFPDLLDGISVIIVLMGLFAVTEIMSQAKAKGWGSTIEHKSTRLVMPSFKKLWSLRKAQAIAIVLGLIEGLTPGGGGSIAAFMSYNEAKRWSKEPEKFGKGSEEGVIAPETANNVVASTALIPTLSFGIPGSNSAAILLSGLLIHGIQPGPQLFVNNPDVVYGLFGGLFVANLAMLVMGYFLLTPVMWLVRRPQPYLLAVIFGLIFSGIFSISNSLLDLALMLATGALGYLMRLFGFPALPLILGAVLGGMIERNYRRSIVLGYGEHWIFLQDPVSATLLALAVLLIGFSLWGEISKKKRGLAATAEPTPQTAGKSGRKKLKTKGS